MKCNDDCFNCKIPSSQCKGGSDKSPYTELNRANKRLPGKGTAPKSAYLPKIILKNAIWKGGFTR